MMYLSGDGWEVKRNAFKEKQEQKKKDIEESKEPPSPFPAPNLCAFIGIGSSEQEMIRLSLEDKVQNLPTTSTPVMSRGKVSLFLCKHII